MFLNNFVITAKGKERFSSTTLSTVQRSHQVFIQLKHNILHLSDYSSVLNNCKLSLVQSIVSLIGIDQDSLYLAVYMCWYFFAWKNSRGLFHCKSWSQFIGKKWWHSYVQYIWKYDIRLTTTSLIILNNWIQIRNIFLDISKIPSFLSP